MPYLFGGLVLLNALTLGYYLFIEQPTTTQSLQTAQAEITRPLSFINSAEHIPAPIGSKD
ncbi:hypothetical protein RCH20_001718 [Psychrobacter sp. PL15]|jgi:hypothetical protein|uniref:hypothetical protein n=1 Tax=unclassified Psychrobacter TaxID=196806 RepID=UPI001AEB4C80|nr:hypothetical protein [Psychrobacter sp. PL15]MEC5210642.1 hypothetical protein [Psychrobacter sp. PL15]